MNKNSLFIECNCHSEGLQIEKQDDGDYWFSFWERGFGSKELNFKEKLRLVFYIFRTGKPYTDMLIFDKEKINKIKEFLSE